MSFCCSRLSAVHFLEIPCFLLSYDLAGAVPVVGDFGALAIAPCIFSSSCALLMFHGIIISNVSLGSHIEMNIVSSGPWLVVPERYSWFVPSPDLTLRCDFRVVPGPLWGPGPNLSRAQFRVRSLS